MLKRFRSFFVKDDFVDTNTYEILLNVKRHNRSDLLFYDSDGILKYYTTTKKFGKKCTKTLSTKEGKEILTIKIYGGLLGIFMDKIRYYKEPKKPSSFSEVFPEFKTISVIKKSGNNYYYLKNTKQTLGNVIGFLDNIRTINCHPTFVEYLMVLLMRNTFNLETYIYTSKGLSLIKRPFLYVSDLL